ncbi:antitermination protein N [Sodalis sp.]|uniref:transcriptional antitermination N peptide n=1 Tax=Sodalis sp. (in: enterobacteria) TaxID=1898979 RepID=UPI003872DA06
MCSPSGQDEDQHRPPHHPSLLTEVSMHHDSQSRRRERRVAKQAEWKAANPLRVGIRAKPLERPVLHLKRKVSRINKAVSPITLTDLFKYQEQITLSAQKHMKARYPHRGAFVEFEEGSYCLPQVALYAAGYQKCENVTAR